MSGNTDPFLVLVDDIGALRRQIENLQRTSLDRDEAKHLNATIAQSLDNMGVCCRTVLNPTLSR